MTKWLCAACSLMLKVVFDLEKARFGECDSCHRQRIISEVTL